MEELKKYGGPEKRFAQSRSSKMYVKRKRSESNSKRRDEPFAAPKVNLDI